MAEHVTKVFISATSRDLRSVRKLVRDALLSMGCLPVVQEHFGPDYRDVSGMLRDKIGECDALIHIAGMRYGTEPELDSLPEGTPRRSYTQMEVDLARELKLEKVFTFVCPEEFPYDTTDEKGNPLEDEPEEMQEMQRQHRERLLSQKELRYRSNSPEELAAQVREIQLELREVKGKLVGTWKKMLKVGAAIAVALVVIVGGVFLTLRGTGELKEGQKELAEQVELQQQAPRVLNAYQERFREIRDDMSRETSLPNTLIDKMVRAELPGIVGLEAPAVSKILEIEAPRLAADRATPINLKLAALFAMGEYDATLEQGKKLLVEPTIAGLRTMGDAALAKFERDPAKALRDQAIRYYRGSQALIDQTAAPENWASATQLLADVLRETGNYEEAEPLYREALEARERVLGMDHPDTLTSINNLALLLKSQGNYEEAEPLYREALDARERVLGRDHPSTLVLINNLASLLKSQGKYEEAEPLCREALEIREHVLGRDHSSTVASIDNLAGLLSLQGKHEEAEPLYREALEKCDRLLGKDHPSTLVSINNLAVLLSSKGDYEEAELLCRDSLEKCNRVLGRHHPTTLVSIINLAGLLKSQGKYEESLLLFRKGLEVSDRVLGGDHPTTIGLINNLAALLESRGEYEEAEPLFREGLEKHERLLGRDHPSTLVSIDNLAGLLKSKGEYEEAELLCREALETKARVLGRNHPSTLVSINNLALLLKSRGNYKEAEPLSREAVETGDRVLGRNHPDTLIWIHNLASLLKLQEKYEEAELLYREAFSKMVGQAWGHPNTQAVKLNFLVFLETQSGSVMEAKTQMISILKYIDTLEPAILAGQLNELGVSCFQESEPNRAEEAYREALAIYAKLENPGTGWIVTTVNLGAALRETGELDEALTHLKTGIEAWKKSEEPNPTALGRAYYHLALTEKARKDPAAAETAFLSSLETYQQIEDPSDAVKAMIEQSRAELAALKAPSGE